MSHTVALGGIMFLYYYEHKHTHTFPPVAKNYSDQRFEINSLFVKICHLLLKTYVLNVIDNV